MENNIVKFTGRLINILNSELGDEYVQNISNIFEDPTDEPLDDPINTIYVSIKQIKCKTYRSL